MPCLCALRIWNKIKDLRITSSHVGHLVKIWNPARICALGLKHSESLSHIRPQCVVAFLHIQYVKVMIISSPFIFIISIPSLNTNAQSHHFYSRGHSRRIYKGIILHVFPSSPPSDPFKERSQILFKKHLTLRCSIN